MERDDVEWMFGKAREDARYRLDKDLLMDVPICYCSYYEMGGSMGEAMVEVVKQSRGPTQTR